MEETIIKEQPEVAKALGRLGNAITALKENVYDLWIRINPVLCPDGWLVSKWDSEEANVTSPLTEQLNELHDLILIINNDVLDYISRIEL